MYVVGLTVVKGAQQLRPHTSFKERGQATTCSRARTAFKSHWVSAVRFASPAGKQVGRAANQRSIAHVSHLLARSARLGSEPWTL